MTAPTNPKEALERLGRYSGSRQASHVSGLFHGGYDAETYADAHTVFHDDLRNALAYAAQLEAALNTPELHDFAKGVVTEAAHQRQRWGSSHDVGKEPEDWFWLLGYLGGKALGAAKSGDRDKALHHTISTAAALANWHAALLGANTDMRPGIDPARPALGGEGS